MSIKSPLNYLRHRRDQNYAQKPTTHEKFATYNYINPQINSTLFSQLPGEIRALICKLALQGSPDLSRPYSIHSWHYRPGYTHARFININLLLTCRRVYLEADHLAISQNEHLIYCPPKHGPPGHIPYLLNSPKYRSLLKRSQREHVQQIHIFAQQLWLEDWNHQLRAYCKTWQDSNYGIGPNSDEHPEKLKFTMRHADWWYYTLGENSPLSLDPKCSGRAPPRAWIPEHAPFMENSWGTRFATLKGLKVFELELETLQDKMTELDDVVDQALGWKFPVPGAQTLVCDRAATAYVMWSGSRRFQGFSAREAARARARQENKSMGEGLVAAESVASVPEDAPSSSRRASIGKLVARNKGKRNGSEPDVSKEIDENAQETTWVADEDKLDFYVVTLVYRAQPDETDAELVEAGKEEEAEGMANSSISQSDQVDRDGTTNGDLPQAAAQPLRQWAPERSGFPTAYG